MARTVNKDALNDKITKLEKAINKNRQQYEKMTAEMKRLNRFLNIFHIIETIKVGLVDHVSCLRAMSINQK
jgi:uncharacterized coiled-coil protein SlyX